MNACQLSLRTAAHARDYRAIEGLIDAGATAADLLYSVIHDIARTGNTLLFEILLCSAPSTTIFRWLELSRKKCDRAQQRWATERYSRYTSALRFGASC